MRWSIIRLIWLRELRDQLRDRRTVFMVVVLPLLLYPMLGFGLLQFALGFGRPQCTVGVVGADNLPPADPPLAPPTPAQVASLLAAVPASPGGIDLVAGAAARARVEALIRGTSYPPLLTQEDGTPRFAAQLFDAPQEADGLSVRLLDAPDGPAETWLRRIDRAPLEAKQVDLILAVPPDFRARLAAGERPALYVLAREGDERSRGVSGRVQNVLGRWKNSLKELRLLRHGLPANYDDVFAIDYPERGKAAGAKVGDGLFDMLVRVFPFMLVMWSLAGALYPAVDLCAGEKERGTMETLLITPASREEIVWGKFLTIWVFSAATTLLNLASMGISTWQFSGILPGEALRPAPLLWCVVLLLPTSAFFSALCLAVGAYARSSKEGQYYLMPLFLLSMPLIFLTLAPGVELNSLYSAVPVTGVALLLQRLMTASSAEQIPWLYFVPVLAPLLFYSWLALRWGIEQFKREEVLFREAERLDVGLWLRRLFRDKEATPSTALAFVCFGVVMALRWLSVGLAPTLGLVRGSGIGLLAFVAAPPVLMALLLTRRPTEALALRKPPARAVLSAALLALLLLVPLVELTRYALREFPEVEELLRQHHPLSQALAELGEHGPGAGWQAVRVAAVYMLVFAVLPAVCEELAFRGFILTGLRRRFRSGTAVVISSFLFAVAHMNVFQFLPTFVLGLVLGVLAVRGGSVLPGMAYHLIHNGLLIGLTCAEQLFGVPEVLATPLVRFLIASLSVSLAALVLWRLVRRTPVVPPTRVMQALCGHGLQPVGVRENR
jgi:sodium transport system permease protein